MRPARWTIALAFTLVYLSWGTTYLAIRKGVEVFPPALFGGVRIGSAGLILLSCLALFRQPLRMDLRDFLWTALVGIILFVGGNGLVTVGEEFVPSGVASVLTATTPLWMALLEMCRPTGERLSSRGWLGLFLGLGGVILLLVPRLREPAALLQDAGPLLILGSALCWALASFVSRRRRTRGSHLTSAAYQMVVGGGCLCLTGICLGEQHRIQVERFTPTAVYAFFHLLVFGSLVGFVAYNWLLGHVSAAMAGTYAYVNPLVAILAGWLLDREEMTVWLVGGMAVILAGVALVRTGGRVASAATRTGEKSPGEEAPGQEREELCEVNREDQPP